MLVTKHAPLPEHESMAPVLSLLHALRAGGGVACILACIRACSER